MGTGEPHPAGEATLLGGADLDGEQVVQELRVAGLGLLGCLERGREVLGGGGELEVDQMTAQLLVGRVLVHLATRAIWA